MLLNKLCSMIILIIIIVDEKSVSAFFYNAPKFCSTASWNPDAITFADGNMLGSKPSGIFVNRDDTVYVAATSRNQTQIYSKENITPLKLISNGLSYPQSVFVGANNDIYVDNGNNRRIDMWAANATNSVPVMYVDSICFGIFVDINDTIYCSMANHHRVTKKYLRDNSNMSIIAAGTGISGSNPIMLYSPRGIFVGINFDLYVADCGNNRIQHFRSGEVNGRTLVGNGAQAAITLQCPTGIILDADNYIFIVDQGNARIIGSGLDGFRCIIGCSGTSGSLSNQLMYPSSFSFDSSGNIFVVDMSNDRIQKFFFASNSCDSQTTSSSSIISTTKTMPTKTYIWTNVTSSANAYSYSYYFLLSFIYITIL